MPTPAMTLESKGPFQKPPVLKGFAQDVSEEIQSWPGMISATHWTIGDSTKVNGADFYVGAAELGHIHLDGEIHLLLTSKIRNLLIEKKLAQAFPWGRDWVQFKISDEISAQTAAWLFQLGYDRLNGLSEAEILLRIQQH
jgi:Family of unknown function (DUF5519)